MTEPDFRWLGSGGAMVLNSTAVVRDALRDGVRLEDLIEDRCADCDTALFLTPADLLAFHDGPGGAWPSETICPACYRVREKEDERQQAAERAALKQVCKAAFAQLKITDPVDRAHAVLPGAVAEVLFVCPELLRQLATAQRIARRWGIDADTLLAAAAKHAEEIE